MSPAKPRLLQIGAGRFGGEHLREWMRVAAAGGVEIVGVVALSDETRASVAAQYDIPVFGALTDELLSSVDAVDIVTPPDTHATLVRRCLPFAHVLVEKPLSTDEVEATALADLAASLGRVLMVGHVYRFHPLIHEVKQLVAAIPELPRGIQGVMINPKAQQVGRAEASLELSHLFDIVDFLFDVEPDIIEGRRRGNIEYVSLRYPGPMTARMRIGWDGIEKTRSLELLYSDRRIAVDLLDNSVVISTRNNQLHKRFFPAASNPLHEELRSFLGAVAEPSESYQADATVGARLVRVALQARPVQRQRRPRVAVIGGGIFGATCALELANTTDVTLFERHASLLTETSTANQRRHHSGFHYPRSYDSIDEIRSSSVSFEQHYGDAIDRSFPAYYCTSATGVEIPAERYLAACQSNHLEFTIVEPPVDVVDRSAVSVCIRTDEGIYNTARLTEIVTARFAATAALECRMQSTVISGALAGDGSKRITVNGPAGTSVESFDYVVNATYAGRNLMAQWFGFPIEPLRFDLCEILQLRLPTPQLSVTVMDGPFTSLTGTGQENLFLLSHIHDSVSRSVIPDDGMPPAWVGLTSNRDNMLRHSAKYFPILKQATDVQSWWMTRAVNAFARDFDARPTVITDHGFGCWSVLGGKIVTSVANAREIATAIEAEQKMQGG